MGLQGPLTAQALGRSPYDDVVDGNGESDPRQPRQQYDHRGRPVNPDTKRRNRDIIRSHNEVMLVIGVAEPEHPASRPEFKSQQRHYEYEEEAGQRLNIAADRCIDVVGLFGIHGLRQRILIYRRYSQLPFPELFRRARSDISVSRDIFPGVPSGLLCSLANFEIKRWLNRNHSRLTSLLVKASWDYFRAHLTLFAALQRLSVIPNHVWLPAPCYFIPFTEESPIPAPSPIDDFTVPSLLRWVGEAVVSAVPFVAWMAISDTIPGLIDGIFPIVLSWMPRPSERGRMLPRPYTPPLSPQPLAPITPGPDVGPLDEAVEFSVPGAAGDPVGDPVLRGILNAALNPANHEHQATHEAAALGSETANRRTSVFSMRGDDYPTDDEGQEGISATLISFDVEATDATEAPPGLWSAELRPSFGQDPRFASTTLPTYLDTHLTRLPACLAASIFTNTVARLLLVPCEATALRLVSRSMLLRAGLPLAGIYRVNMADGLTLTSVVNYLGVELLLMGLSGEVWATFAALSQWLHMSEEEWKSHDEEMQTEK